LVDRCRQRSLASIQALAALGAGKTRSLGARRDSVARAATVFILAPTDLVDRDEIAVGGPPSSSD
jgi:hypothetical protein